jgi:hypothetical protein
MANVVDRAREGEEPGRLGLPFWQLWSASSLSNLADGLVKVALPLVAVTLTDSPGLIAGVTLAVPCPGCCSPCRPGRWPTGWTDASRWSRPTSCGPPEWPS